MSVLRVRGWRVPGWGVDALLGGAVGVALWVSVAGWWLPHDLDARSMDAVGWILVGLAAGAVALRRRVPLGAFVLAWAAALAWLLLGYEGVVVLAGPVILGYTVATRRGPWWGVGAGVAGLALGAVVILARFGAAGLDEAVAAGAGLTVAAVAVGMALRSYRAYVAMLDAQMRRAEADREAEARRRVELERLRIARELHDVVSHTIATINVQASTAAYVAARDPAADPETTVALTAIKQASGEALRDLRAMLGMLRRAGDEDARDAGGPRPAPGLEEVGALAEETRAAGVAVAVVTEGRPRPLPAPVRQAAYRIVQESLTNVRRHAAAERVTVTLAYTPEGLEVTVTDDGSGPGGGDAADRAGTGGFGLLGMRERAEALGGALHTGPAGGGGFQVRCQLPAGPAVEGGG